MSYQFCLGASGAGKSTELHRWVIRQAQDALARFDFSRNYLVVVPDQYTMQTQKDLVLAAGDADGILNVDVLSFGRLSHRIFEEVGEDHRTVLDDMGKSLVLRRLVTECRRDLKVLDRQIDRLGMITEVKSAISEFMQYGIGAEDVGRLADYAAAHGQGGLALRLQDLRTLYEAFLAAGEDGHGFVTGEETLDVLAGKIPASRIVKGSILIFDGFTGFTPVQYRVLRALMQNAAKVIFALDYGADGGTPLEEVVNGAPFEAQDLFYLTRKTVNDIARMAARDGIPREKDWIVGGENRAAGQTDEPDRMPARFRGNPSLSHLERSLFRYPARPFDGNGQNLSVHLAVCSNPGQEVRQMCIRIRKLTEEKGYSYRDFGIVTGDLEGYEDALLLYADRYGIPIYVDSNRAVLQNPLTETIRAALEISAGDYRYETVFRFLRSGLSGLSAEEIDRLENYCLARGIRSRKRWETAFDEEFEDMREKVVGMIRPLQDPGDRSAAARSRALYAFLTGIHAGEQMQALSEEYEAAGDTARAMEYGQIYAAVVHLLDELYELLGEEKVTAEEFQKLAEAGFEEIRLGVLPQQVDRVLAGDIERTRMPEVKVLFFLGVNDGIIPRGTSKGGILSDLDREFLQESDVLRDSGGELAPTPRQQMYIQRLYLYMNMTRPSDELYVSYVRTAGDGSSVRPSYLIGMLRQIFPSLEERIPEEDPLSEQMVSPGDAASFLSAGLRDYADGLYLHAPEHPELHLSEKLDEFKTIYGFCARSEETLHGGGQAGGAAGTLREETEKLRDAAFFRYQHVPISRRTARKLYGRIIRGSVTRLETAAQCFLRQYLHYGLRLEERPEYTFEPNDSGTILHESIQRFGQLLKENGIGWTDCTREQGHELVMRALQESAGGYRDQVLFATQRTAYQTNRLLRILERTVDTLQFQLRAGDFLPAALEEPFGERDGLQFPLQNGGILQLAGRIDRVDLAVETESPAEDREKSGRKKIYVKILDYKSGNRDLDPKMMRAGIQLQLLLYLCAEERRLHRQYPGAEIIPSAMLYYHFDDPMLGSADAEKILEEAIQNGEGTAKDLELRTILQKLRPKGMVGSEEEILAHLDHELNGSSLVVPVKRLRSGKLGAGSRVFSQEEFRQMESALKEKVCGLAGRILEGDIQAYPAVLRQNVTACTYCQYKNVCGFDLRIPGYEYNEKPWES